MGEEPRKTRAKRAATQALESLQRAGVKALPKAKRAARPLPAASASTEVERSPKVTPAPPVASGPASASKTAPPVTSLPRGTPPSSRAVDSQALEIVDSLDQVRQEVAACRACHELATTRTQTVFGVGNPRAKLCFMGEAPGADEDKQGEPFVGRAGQLLTKIIEACRLSRSDVYILNTLKCRPPGNRNPLPDEVRNCRGFLDRQLRLIQPEYICCLGAVAAHALLETDVPIGRMRGRFYDYRGIQVMCTYHPAYLLRNPEAKKFVWEDMKALMRKLGVELG